MGAPTLAILAENFMQYLKHKKHHNFKQTSNFRLNRYVDGILII
jgi:uncharacterized protein YehS (DUF1456 family)